MDSKRMILILKILAGGGIVLGVMKNIKLLWIAGFVLILIVNVINIVLKYKESKQNN